MGTITKYGRDFQVDDNVAPDVADARINNWMQTHAPDELKSGAAAAEPGETTTPPPPTAPQSKSRATDMIRQAAGMVMPTLAAINPLTNPYGVLGLFGEGRKALADPNHYRTLAQGALPYADEGIAKIRSMLPGGPDYDTALDQERKGVEQYGKDYGPLMKGITELYGGVGAAGATGAGLGALGKGYTGLSYLDKLARTSPIKSGLLQALKAAGIGAGTGAVAGFGAGEGGLEDRLEAAKTNAGMGAVLGPAALGVAKAVPWALDSLNSNRTIANYLRQRGAIDRGTSLRNKAGVPLTPEGDLDVNHPDFDKYLTDEMRDALAKERGTAITGRGQQTATNSRGQDVMVSDILPGTTEAVTQQPTEKAGALADKLVKRQYDPDLPEATARGASQWGRINKAFDRAFGQDTFRGTRAQLEQEIKDNARAAFEPAYAKNIGGAEIEDALNDPYVGKAWQAAKDKMESQRKPIGVVNPVTNNISQYNTEFLHTVKRTMDDMVRAARNAPEGTTGMDTARVIGSSKNRLNEAIMNANPEYASAMKKYGEEADVLSALKKGHDEMFPGARVDEPGGMTPEDIKAWLADSDRSQPEKDMFRLGAARSLRQKLLGSESKQYGGDWASALNNPNMEQKYASIVDPNTMGSWDLFRAQMAQESGRTKNMQRALGNSATARRMKLDSQMGNPLLADIAGAVVNPSAPSVARGFVRRALGSVGLDQQSNIANRAAGILAGSGRKGNEASIQQIRDLLAASRTRDVGNRTIQGVAPYVAPWAIPNKVNE